MIVNDKFRQVPPSVNRNFNCSHLSILDRRAVYSGDGRKTSGIFGLRIRYREVTRPNRSDWCLLGWRDSPPPSYRQPSPPLSNARIRFFPMRAWPACCVRIFFIFGPFDEADPVLSIALGTWGYFSCSRVERGINRRPGLSG